MATWFEFRAAAGDPKYVQQAFEEAFRLIDHLEALLSRFREASEVSAISRLAPGETLSVHPDTAACLDLALEMAELTGGAFDPALGAASDRQRLGLAAPEPVPRGRLLLDLGSRTVTCEGAPVSLDLGAIGKGFALDQVAELLIDWQLGPCLLVGGGSSILALDDAVERPASGAAWEVNLTEQTGLQLMRGSVGCSGLSVKGAHILDPRTGAPAITPARAWALAGRAAVSDALSTAFMILSLEEIATVCEQRPEVAAIVQNDARVPDVVRIGRGLGVSHQFVRGPEEKR